MDSEQISLQMVILTQENIDTESLTELVNTSGEMVLLMKDNLKME